MLFAVKSICKKSLEKLEIPVLWDSVVTEVLGEEKVTGVRVKNVRTGETSDIETKGVFVAIGLIPNSEIAREAGVALDKYKQHQRGQGHAYLCSAHLCRGRYHRRIAPDRHRDQRRGHGRHDRVRGFAKIGVGRGWGGLFFLNPFGLLKKIRPGQHLCCPA